MHLLSAGAVAVLLFGIVYQVSSTVTVIGTYGETLELPCNNGSPPPDDVMFIQWKLNPSESGMMIKKLKGKPFEVLAKDGYSSRVSMMDNGSMFLEALTLEDQKVFICMLVNLQGLLEHHVRVVVHKDPTNLELLEQAAELEIGKLAKIGQCNAIDANPAANITWFKNNKTLSADGKGIVIDDSVQVHAVTGLSTTSSTLRYSAGKGDADASFTCGTLDLAGQPRVSLPVTFTITYPTENVSLKVLSEGVLLEGDNVTLRCVADGNPAPTTFNFFIKGEVKNVVDSDSYTMTNINRDATGEYKCSLAEKPSLEASINLTVSYLNVDLSPSEEVVKKAGDTLVVALKVDSSGDHKVSWTKDNGLLKADQVPTFKNLTYSDAGVYEGQVTLGPLRRVVSFQLVVEGAPVITLLAKRLGEDGRHKVLICEAEGYPKPTITWSVNGTWLEETPYINGKVSQKITVVPSTNLTVYCTVSNQFSQQIQSINVSSLFEEVRMDKQDQSDNGDQTKLAIGIVAGLLLVGVIVGLAYWIYMKRSKQGSWKTGELENGSSEEEKKLEEKVEENSQKAEM
ncbi:CD166 antigen homolog A-like isoform X1 [Gadus macrocephalus]|uniref:CD166 antigen homolog A-like isoform X1 n=1 Tax=Gadus macrocephalus TaxID=80720 RepID=UPI0028CB5F57|nr:CD166 antigen homolog A-like isoform X1 [Gadus macrocephalus]